MKLVKSQGRSVVTKASAVDDDCVTWELSIIVSETNGHDAMVRVDGAEVSVVPCIL